MRNNYLILTLISCLFCMISCEETTNDPDLLNASDLKNSIFYVTQHSDQFSNNNNLTSFFIYKSTTGSSVKLPIELTGNAAAFQLINSTLYFTQSNLIKSYNLLTKKIKNHIALPPDAISWAISPNESLLAFRSTNQITILNLLTAQAEANLENQLSFNLLWSPVGVICSSNRHHH